MTDRSVGPVRLERFDELLAPGGAEPRGHSDVLEHARLHRRARAAVIRRRPRPCANGSRRPRSPRSARASPSSSPACPAGSAGRPSFTTTPSKPGPLEPREPVPGHVRPGGHRRQMDRGFGLRRVPLRGLRGARRTARIWRSASPRASRSKATNEAGVSRDSSSTRDAAGWIRCDSVSKSRPVGSGDHDLAVDDAGSGRLARVATRPARGSSGSAASRSGCPRTTSSPSRKTMQRNPSHFGS